MQARKERKCISYLILQQKYIDLHILDNAENVDLSSVSDMKCLT